MNNNLLHIVPIIKRIKIKLKNIKKLKLFSSNHVYVGQA